MCRHPERAAFGHSGMVKVVPRVGRHTDPLHDPARRRVSPGPKSRSRAPQDEPEIGRLGRRFPRGSKVLGNRRRASASAFRAAKAGRSASCQDLSNRCGAMSANGTRSEAAGRRMRHSRHCPANPLLFKGGVRRPLTPCPAPVPTVKLACTNTTSHAGPTP